jgi:hypothetical protein
MTSDARNSILQTRFLNARSPLRLLEKGLHGGLGPGNVGAVLAGRGVGKTSFLVCVALDELLRGGHVLHVCLDHTLSHVRAYYDTVFEELASTTHLEDEAMVHADIDRRRSIRVYPKGSLSASKLRDAVKLETEAGGRPSLLILEGVNVASLPEDELRDLKALAGELAAEVWLEAQTSEERPAAVPASVARFGDLVSVVLTLEPGDAAVALRALKDHDNPDLEALHVALDPKTLLLVRN